MKALKYFLLQAVVWALVGACAMAGMKAVDWLIPNPPREPLRIEIKKPDQPAAQSQHLHRNKTS
jgi:hypothetical protein